MRKHTRTSSTRSTPTRADLWTQLHAALTRTIDTDADQYDGAFCCGELSTMLEELEAERCACGKFFDENTPHAATCPGRLCDEVRVLQRAYARL